LWPPVRVSLVVKKHSQATVVCARNVTDVLVTLLVPVVMPDTGVMPVLTFRPLVMVLPVLVAVFVVRTAAVTVAMRLVIDVVMVVAAAINPIIMFATILLVMTTPATVVIISTHHQRCTHQTH